MEQVKLPPLVVSTLLAAGYGRMELTPPDHEGGPSFGRFFISLVDMERMGEDERIRLGVQDFYLFAIEHAPTSGPIATSNDQVDVDTQAEP